MKKIVCLVLSLLMLCTTLVACAAPAPVAATTAPAATAAQDETMDLAGKKIAVSFMSLNNPFWVAENETLKAEIAKRGGELVTYDAALNMEKQIAQIEDALASGVDAVILSPYDWKGIKPALESCKAKNVPVVVIDTKVFDGDLVAAQVVSDNYMGGQLCAQALIDKLGTSFKVAILDLSTNMAVQDRTAGFHSIIDKEAGIEVVAAQDGDGSVEAALPIMENMLQAHPEIQAVFGTNDPAAIGCIAAIQSANRTDILVVGIDGAKDACELIAGGQLLGTAAQYPSKLASKVVEVVNGIFDGTYPAEDKKIIYVEEAWVNMDNVKDYAAKNAY